MELIFSLILVVILIGAYFRSLSFGGMEISTDKIGPGGLPQIIILLCLLLMAFIIWGSLKKREKRKANLTHKGFVIMLVNIAMFGIYIFFMNVIGFVLSTFFYGTVAIRTMGYKSLGKSTVFMFVLTVLVTLVFGRIFYVSLPRGISLFRHFSYFIY